MAHVCASSLPCPEEALVIGYCNGCWSFACLWVDLMFVLLSPGVGGTPQDSLLLVCVSVKMNSFISCVCRWGRAGAWHCSQRINGCLACFVLPNLMILTTIMCGCWVGCALGCWFLSGASSSRSQVVHIRVALILLRVRQAVGSLCFVPHQSTAWGLFTVPLSCMRSDADSTGSESCGTLLAVVIVLCIH